MVQNRSAPKAQRRTPAEVRIPVIRGRSSDRDVLLGFASARLLASLSFADVLDESGRSGYQRRFNPAHSADFRRYIKKPGSTTIPLTFNLRPAPEAGNSPWRIAQARGESAVLIIRTEAGRPLAQVDCQHRLGKIGDLDVTLPFMTFVGLSEREELEIFNVINSKAKGLSGSLLDYHASRLSSDLAEEEPDLYIALFLHESPESPWYQQLDIGGNQTVGTQRRATLRTMRTAMRKRFFAAVGSEAKTVPALEIAQVFQAFWQSVAAVLPEQWNNPRKNMLNKGIGVYALTSLVADIWRENVNSLQKLTRAFFERELRSFAVGFDWSSSGPLKGFGGEGGADEAHLILRRERARMSSSPREPHMRAATRVARPSQSTVRNG
jgi:DNA sulfur modification protein DndB